MKKIFTFLVITVFALASLNAQTTVEAEDANTLTGKIKVNNAGDGLDGIKTEDAGVITTATYNNISVSESGQHTFYFNTSGFQSGARIILEVDGVEKGYTNLVSTGGWGTYENSNPLIADLTSGTHTFKLTFSHNQQFDDDETTNFTGWLCNIDYFTFEKGIPAAIKSLPASDVKTYPLPASDVLNVELVENGKLALYSIAGTEVYINNNATTSNQIDVSGLQSGIYIIKVETPSGVLTRKVTVK